MTTESCAGRRMFVQDLVNKARNQRRWSQRRLADQPRLRPKQFWTILPEVCPEPSVMGDQANMKESVLTTVTVHTSG